MSKEERSTQPKQTSKVGHLHTVARQARRTEERLGKLARNSQRRWQHQEETLWTHHADQRKSNIPQNVLGTTMRLSVRTNKTEQDVKPAREMGKQIWRRRRFLERKLAQESLIQRVTYMDTTALFMDKDPTEDLTAFCESLFNVEKENMAEA